MVVATGAGVHRCYEHEGAGEGEVVAGTGDGDGAVFERLAQGFEHGTAELWKLVEEENAVVCQADFAWHKGVAATDKCHVGNGVVGRTEGTLADE